MYGEIRTCRMSLQNFLRKKRYIFVKLDTVALLHIPPWLSGNTKFIVCPKASQKLRGLVKIVQ